MSEAVRMMLEQDFWDWFARNESRLRRVRDNREGVLDALAEQLAQYCSGLVPEMSSSFGEPREFIVSAGGRVPLFPKAAALVDAAPSLGGWEFVALKPALGFDFTTDFEGIRFDPHAMSFLRLENPNRPDLLGLRVFVPNISATDIDRATRAIWQVLETGLGERVCGERISYVEACPAPAHHDPGRTFKLAHLPEYLNARSKRR